MKPDAFPKGPKSLEVLGNLITRKDKHFQKRWNKYRPWTQSYQEHVKRNTNSWCCQKPVLKYPQIFLSHGFRGYSREVYLLLSLFYFVTKSSSSQTLLLEVEFPQGPTDSHTSAWSLAHFSAFDDGTWGDKDKKEGGETLAHIQYFINFIWTVLFKKMCCKVICSKIWKTSYMST